MRGVALAIGHTVHDTAEPMGRLKGRQRKEFCRMHASGDYMIADLSELFSISRRPVHRTLRRSGG